MTKTPRRPYLPKAVAADFKRQLVDHLKAGGNIKSFVIDTNKGISTTFAYRHAREMGWHSRMLHDVEFDELQQRRKQGIT